MQTFKMEVSKKVKGAVGEKGEYEKVGDVDIFYPLLSELGLIVDPVNVAEIGTLDKDKNIILPEYKDEKVQYVWDAVWAAVKASARNKLVSGSVALKEGLSIASTVEELIATGERSGEALANRRDAIKSLVAFVPTTGKSAAVQQWVVEQCKNLAGIPYQSEGRRKMLLSILDSFVDSLDAEKATKYSRFLTQISEYASASMDVEDLPA